MDRRTLLQALAAGLLAPPLARAYTLPAPSILRRAARRLAGSAGLQVALVGRVRASGQARGRAVPVGERWLFRAGATEVKVNGPGERTASWKAPRRTSGDTALLPTPLERRVLPALFARGDVSGLTRSLGVDTGRVALDLISERVAYVVGGSPQTPGPRLWVDKESFAVLGVRDEKGDTVQLTRWDLPPGFGRFPGELRATRGRRWARVMRTETVSGVGR